jgi:hypothetical protein
MHFHFHMTLVEGVEGVEVVEGGEVDVRGVRVVQWKMK